MRFGVYITDFQILSIKLPQEVEDYYVKYWEAERQNLATIMDGKARAFIFDPAKKSELTLSMISF